MKEVDVMKIAAYARVSTEKEAQIDSLEKQIEFFNDFTKNNRILSCNRRRKTDFKKNEKIIKDKI